MIGESPMVVELGNSGMVFAVPLPVITSAACTSAAAGALWSRSTPAPASVHELKALAIETSELRVPSWMRIRESPLFDGHTGLPRGGHVSVKPPPPAPSRP